MRSPSKPSFLHRRTDKLAIAKLFAGAIEAGRTTFPPHCFFLRTILCTGLVPPLSWRTLQEPKSGVERRNGAGSHVPDGESRPVAGERLERTPAIAAPL